MSIKVIQIFLWINISKMAAIFQDGRHFIENIEYIDFNVKTATTKDKIIDISNNSYV